MVILFVFIISSVVWFIPDIGMDHDKGSTSSELTVQETMEENVARISYVDAEGNLTCAIDKHYATIVKTYTRSDVTNQEYDTEVKAVAKPVEEKFGRQGT